MSEIPFDIQALLGRLEKVKKYNSRGWMSLCPAHRDKDRSLSVARGHDGRILIHCHAGCPPSAVLAAIGLTFEDLFPDGRISDWVPGQGFSARKRAHKTTERDKTVLAVAEGARASGRALSPTDLRLEREAFKRELKRKRAGHVAREESEQVDQPPSGE